MEQINKTELLAEELKQVDPVKLEEFIYSVERECGFDRIHLGLSLSRRLNNLNELDYKLQSDVINAHEEQMVELETERDELLGKMADISDWAEEVIELADTIGEELIKTIAKKISHETGN